MSSAHGRRRRVGQAFAGMLFAGLSGLSPSARAQASAPTAPASANASRIAQSLFEEGRALLDAGRYADACPKLAESQRLDPGGGTLLNLALCYEKLGRTATAWAEFNEALSLAIADRRGEREAFARTHIAALSARLPRVRVSSAGPAPDLVIRIDGEPMPAAALDTATPVDPGPHTLQASSAGHLPWTTTLTAKEGETTSVSVPPLPLGPAASTSPESKPPAQAAPPGHVELHRSAAFWAVGGVAVAGAVTSIVTGLVALSAHQSADSKCDVARSFCADPTGIDDASRATTYAWVSTAALGVAVVAGVVAILLPREASGDEPKAKLAFGVTPAPGGAFFGVGGAFR